jgi:transcriptional repressor NrdR
MKCPFCDGSTRVTDSRPISDGIRRRRECNLCRRRFTTHERMVPPDVRVVKADDRQSEAFAPEKIVRVLRRVCKGCAVPREEIERIALVIETTLLDGGRKAVHSAEIARMVLDELEKVNRMAHHRFAADYLDVEGKVRLESPEPEELEARQYQLFDE